MCRTCEKWVKQHNKVRKSRMTTLLNRRPWEPLRIPCIELKYKLHQASFYERFWRLSDLVFVVRQPIRYVRKVLLKMAVYQRQHPYRGYWAFKPKFCMMLY